MPQKGIHGDLPNLIVGFTEGDDDFAGLHVEPTGLREYVF